METGDQDAQISAPTPNSSTYEQTKLLLRKNKALLLRNLTSTLMQVLVGLLFMILLSVINYGLESDRITQQAFSETLHMPEEAVSKLSRCVPSEGSVCYTFAYAPNDNKVIADIVDSILVSNNLKLEHVDKSASLKAKNRLWSDNDAVHSQTYKPYEAIGFKNTKDMQTWIYNHPNTTNLAVTFQNVNGWGSKGSNMKYTLQVNTTSTCTNFVTKVV